jgi:site-specific DNA-methyltransferase (adenine-specific)
MQIHSIPVDEILIPKNRQRKEFKAEDLIDLAGSITKNGLMHPVVVRKDADGNVMLVAGERRLKAMAYVWNFGDSVECGDYQFPENCAPCIMHSELSELDAFEMELEENIRRVDLPWQDRAAATKQLYDLRKAQAEAAGEKLPGYADIAEEVHGTSPAAADQTRMEILVASHLDDEDVKGARTAKDAFKALKRKEDVRRNEALAQSVGVTFTNAVHRLEQGDCFEILESIPAESFDVILTDPPYGIDADQFGDSGGNSAGSHFYDDSWTTWNLLARRLAGESFRVAKAKAHAYMFCDIDNFVMFKSYMQEAGWKVFRTPLIWINPTAFRAPWPDQGPQRKYQVALYAVKGNRPVSRLYPDVLTYTSDDNLGHQAQKPVDLYVDLLKRSANPGDTVLDPFMGSGPIIPAAHQLKCRATGIEINPAAYGIAVSRLKGLE